MFSKSFIKLLYDYSITEFEIKEIENIIFYFVLGDYDIIEDYLKFKKGLIDEPILDLRFDDKN